MDYKIICSAVAIALTFTAFIPYMHDIVRGHIKPHVFSWVIWGVGDRRVRRDQHPDCHLGGLKTVRHYHQNRLAVFCRHPVITAVLVSHQ